MTPENPLSDDDISTTPAGGDPNAGSVGDGDATDTTDGDATDG